MGVALTMTANRISLPAIWDAAQRDRTAGHGSKGAAFVITRNNEKS